MSNLFKYVKVGIFSKYIIYNYLLSVIYDVIFVLILCSEVLLLPPLPPGYSSQTAFFFSEPLNQQLVNRHSKSSC